MIPDNPQYPGQKVKSILDYKIIDEEENRVCYLVVWNDEEERTEWVEDDVLVGADQLIREFFQKGVVKKEEPVVNSQYKESGSQGQDRTKTRSGGKKKTLVKIENQPKWSIRSGGKQAIAKAKDSLKAKSKSPSKTKKYEEEDVKILKGKIRNLTAYIKSERAPEDKLDYLYYVEGVFMKGGRPYCGVKTMTPVRTYVVSLKDMERYFPLTLREHLRNVVGLMRRGHPDESEGEENSDSD